MTEHEKNIQTEALPTSNERKWILHPVLQESVIHKEPLRGMRGKSKRSLPWKLPNWRGHPGVLSAKKTRTAQNFYALNFPLAPGVDWG